MAVVGTDEGKIRFIFLKSLLASIIHQIDWSPTVSLASWPMIDKARIRHAEQDSST